MSIPVVRIPTKRTRQAAPSILIVRLLVTGFGTGQFRKDHERYVRCRRWVTLAALRCDGRADFMNGFTVEASFGAAGAPGYLVPPEV